MAIDNVEPVRDANYALFKSSTCARSSPFMSQERVWLAVTMRLKTNLSVAPPIYTGIVSHQYQALSNQGAVVCH